VPEGVDDHLVQADLGHIDTRSDTGLPGTSQRSPPDSGTELLGHAKQVAVDTEGERSTKSGHQLDRRTGFSDSGHQVDSATADFWNQPLH
jgi:hypothetical protein